MRYTIGEGFSGDELAQLRKENEQLKQKLYSGNKNVFAELNIETAESNEQLMLEIADLKKQIDCLSQSYDKYAEVMRKQLTEAKEIIKDLLSFIQKENYRTRWDINTDKAEQFLKECEE